MKYHFLVVANGPFLSKDVILEAAMSKSIIALDGAAEKLRQLDIMPDIILGDFDSMSSEQISYWGIKSLTAMQQPYSGNFGVLIVPAYNQHYTDLEKAIHYCDQQLAHSITFICATGGRYDLHENTLYALAHYYRPDRLMFLHTELQTLRYAKNEKLTLLGRPGDKCGISATHTGTVSSSGLAYELNEHTVSFANILLSTSAVLTVKGCALLIMPPQLITQRKMHY